MKENRKKGFTLIELVVVIGIVLVIASIVFFSLTKNRSKSRDQQRIADLNTIAQSLTQYNTQYRSYPYWEMTKNKQGIFNWAFTGVCDNAYPCIYDATSGSSWRKFTDSFLSSRPVDPKGKGEKQYYYNATSDTSTPPSHYAVGVLLESNGYSATKYSTDPWYTAGYCQAQDCLPEFPISDGWMYIVGS